MDANNTSFFDEPLEDESITLSDNELNNILEDSGLDNADTSFINEEPDVIVVDKSNLNDQDLNTSGPIEIDKNDFVEESIETQPQPAVESDNVSINDIEFEDMVEDTKTDLPDIETLPEEVLPEETASTESVEEVSLDEALPEEATSTESVEEVSLDEALPKEAASTESVEEVNVDEALPKEAASTESVEEVNVDEALPEETTSTESVEEVSLDEALPEEAASTESVEEVSLDEALPEKVASTESVEEINDSPTVSEPLYNDEAEGNTTLPEEVSNNSFFEDNDEDESITLNTEELNNILGEVETEVSPEPDVDVSSETVLPVNTPEVVESQSAIEEPKEVVEQAPQFSSQKTGAISEDTLKEIFVYLDNLLEKLPDDEIRKFAESHYYDLYNQIFEKLNLI